MAVGLHHKINGLPPFSFFSISCLRSSQPPTPNHSPSPSLSSYRFFHSSSFVLISCSLSRIVIFCTSSPPFSIPHSHSLPPTPTPSPFPPLSFLFFSLSDSPSSQSGQASGVLCRLGHSIRQLTRELLCKDNKLATIPTPAPCGAPRTSSSVYSYAAPRSSPRGPGANRSGLVLLRCCPSSLRLLAALLFAARAIYTQGRGCLEIEALHALLVKPPCPLPAAQQLPFTGNKTTRRSGRLRHSKTNPS